MKEKKSASLLNMCRISHSDGSSHNFDVMDVLMRTRQIAPLAKAPPSFFFPHFNFSVSPSRGGNLSELFICLGLTVLRPASTPTSLARPDGWRYAAAAAALAVLAASRRQELGKYNNRSDRVWWQSTCSHAFNPSSTLVLLRNPLRKKASF